MLSNPEMSASDPPTMIEVGGLAKSFPSPEGTGDLTVFNEVNFKIKKARSSV